MLRREENNTAKIKKWLKEKSKTRPGQWVISLGSGAGCASGLHYLIDVGLAFIPVGPTLTALKAANYVLNGIIFFAATGIVLNGQTKTTQQLNQEMVELKQENAELNHENAELKFDLIKQTKNNDSMFKWLRRLSKHVNFNAHPFLETHAREEGYVLIPIQPPVDAQPMTPRTHSLWKKQQNAKRSMPKELQEPLLAHIQSRCANSFAT